MIILTSTSTKLGLLHYIIVGGIKIERVSILLLNLGKRAVTFSGLLLTVIGSYAFAQVPMPPETPPVTQAYHLSTAPKIDGQVIGDPAWNEVHPTSDFWQTQPDEGRPATQKTEVYIGFTNDSLYIGVICFDDNPAGIIIADSRRDSSLQDTDSFQIILDTFQDKQNGFVFGTNPAGIEYDGQAVNAARGSGSGRAAAAFANYNLGGFNLNWDTSWTVKASISDIGWSAEMEIPFRSLRYTSQDIQTWGVNFQRNIQRNKEVVFWSPLSRQHNLYRLYDAGMVEGIKVPNQRNLKMIPYVLGQVSRGGDLSASNHYDQELGIDIKYSITPSLTLDFTYNTDFAQVEVDEQQVNLDRFSLFFPEKRPFFLENADQFSVGNSQEVELFFSRRIGISSNGEPIPIDTGLRLSGKLGSATNVGLLYMSSEALPGIAPGNDYAVARVSHELENRSSIGALFVDRSGDGSLLPIGSDDYNRTYAIDGRWGIGEKIDLGMWAAKTDTPKLSGDNNAFTLKTNYSSANWSNKLMYTSVGENFNPEVGFLDRKNYRKYDGTALRRIRPEDLWGLHEIRPHITYRGYWGFDDFHETGYLHMDTHWEWRNGLEIHTGVNFTLEGVRDPFEIYDGVMVEPGTYKHKIMQLVYWTDDRAPLSFRLRATRGGFFGGDKTMLRPALRYRIGETFSTELAWTHNDIKLPVANGNFEVNVVRLRVSYSFTPKMLLQALVQYDDRNDITGTNLRFSWLQSANAGFFLVYNEIDERGFHAPLNKGREFLIKYSKIFDVLN